jgi:uncharacterized protein YndB with AHSA1/START domain
MSSRAVHLHRVLRTTPEKLYRAFLDPLALAKWLPPHGFTCQVHSMEAAVGKGFRMSFFNFSTGNGHSFSGEYLELVPNERIRYTDKFDDPNLPGDVLPGVARVSHAAGGAGGARHSWLNAFCWATTHRPGDEFDG